MRYYYIESDGRVFLVEEAGKLRFPRSTDEFDFEIEIIARMPIEGQEVLFCKPKLSTHPQHWWHKDEIPLFDQAEPIVRLAVNISLPRVTAKAVILKNNKILMVKPKRGLTTGRWTLPGGFVGYGESPKEAVEREVQEEVGAECHARELLSVESGLGKQTAFHWHTFFYEVELLSDTLKPAPDEIEQIAWFAPDDALKSLGYSGEIKQKIQELFSGKAPSHTAFEGCNGSRDGYQGPAPNT